VGEKRVHVAGSLLVLYALWLLLSGHGETWLLALGALSALGVLLFSLRMEVVDHESYPLHLHPVRVVRYWGWLLAEIVRSGIAVTRSILDPALPISPTVVRVRTSGRSPLGRVVYANSITLTPGTVSIDVTEGEIEVHALTREFAQDLEGGEMDRRIRGLEISGEEGR